METLDLVKQIVESLDKHKALNIRVLRVTDITALADYFVIAAGTSSTHVRSLVDYTEFELGQQHIHPFRTEGYQTALWTLLDYGQVVVHVFQEETRNFYDLERLWKDGEELDLMTFLDNGGQENEKI